MFFLYYIIYNVTLALLIATAARFLVHRHLIDKAHTTGLGPCPARDVVLSSHHGMLSAGAFHPFDGHGCLPSLIY